MVKISAALPTHMKAVVLKIYDGTPQSVAAEDFSVPRLRSGQVLIKMAASPAGNRKVLRCNRLRCPVINLQNDRLHVSR